MKLPKPYKKKLMAGVAALLLATGTGFGLWRFLRHADGLVAEVSSVLSVKPSVRIYHLPSDNDGTSESASSRRGGEKGSALFDWGNRTLLQNVREVEIAQSGLAAGEHAASDELKSGMMRIYRYLQTTKLDDLQPTEIEAVIEYTLSGGQPAFAEEILKKKKLSQVREALLRGVVAFVSGNSKQSSEILKTLDANQFKPVVAARLLMIQAELASRDPYQIRRTKLAKAADLALGSLIEEGATRRIVILAADARAADDFYYWSDRYIRRFSKSLYIADFVANFIDALFIFEKSNHPVPLDRVDRIFSNLSPQSQIQLASNLQQAAVRLGEPRLCNYAYQKSKDLIASRLILEDRPKLYSVACNIGRPGAFILSELSQFDVSKLDEADRKLHDSAEALARGIDFQNIGSHDSVYGPSIPYPNFDSVKALDARVRQQFGSTDRVIKGIGK